MAGETAQPPDMQKRIMRDIQEIAQVMLFILRAAGALLFQAHFCPPLQFTSQSIESKFKILIEV